MLASDLLKSRYYLHGTDVKNAGERRITITIKSTEPAPDHFSQHTKMILHHHPVYGGRRKWCVSPANVNHLITFLGNTHVDTHPNKWTGASVTLETYTTYIQRTHKKVTGLRVVSALSAPSSEFEDAEEFEDWETDEEGLENWTPAPDSEPPQALKKKPKKSQPKPRKRK